MPSVAKSYLIGFLVGYAIAVLTSFVRLGHRLYRRQLWWDDLWACIALLFAFCSITVYLFLNIPDNPQLQYQDNLVLSSFLVWSAFFFQPAVVWSSRLSIQVTVIRLLPPGRNRTISKWAFGVLVLMWIAATISKVFYCGTDVPQIPNCVYSNVPSAVSLTLDVLATAWLVGWPAYILIRMNLKKPHRRLLIVCFSSGVLLGTADILHAADLIVADKAWERIVVTGHLEIMLALVLSNVLVLATYVYRVFRSSTGDSTDDSESSFSSRKSTTKREDARTRGVITQSRSFHPGSAIGTDSSVGPLTTVYTSGDESSNPSTNHRIGVPDESFESSSAPDSSRIGSGLGTQQRLDGS